MGCEDPIQASKYIQVAHFMRRFYWLDDKYS